MATVRADTNDMNIYTDGDPTIVPLDDDDAAEVALSFCDALQYGTTENDINVGDDSADAKYLGACLNGGGVAIGSKPTVGRFFVHNMTIAAETADVSQGDRVKAVTATTCEKVAPLSGLYTYPENTYGVARSAGVAGEVIKIFVDPQINQ